ncbi:hypothetical protein JOC34_004126 [Virgibacillus halotolerans]|uniref:sporulation YhaL family protein n=1 Tax=Virgibacillus halotolerans TaxID=1071053 RepID=UPI00195F6D29|nr:sporulation YhaL family protein [Virgibacillus halotolerans]MBM7601698.1 hypothetical protein [Virgibacillus halotolerans]
MIAGVPWWVLAMIVLIFLCGYMAFKAMSAERKVEQQYIEEEGKIYMDRIEAERQLKAGQRQRLS